MDVEAFELWVASDPTRQRLLALLAELWDGDDLASEFDVQAMWARTPARSGAPECSRSSRASRITRPFGLLGWGYPKSSPRHSYWLAWRSPAIVIDRGRRG